MGHLETVMSSFRRKVLWKNTPIHSGSRSDWSQTLPSLQTLLLPRFTGAVEVVAWRYLRYSMCVYLCEWIAYVCGCP